MNATRFAIATFALIALPLGAQVTTAPTLAAAPVLTLPTVSRST